METNKAAAVKPRLPPGFRFRPTDEELVVHYLRRRALACPMPPAVDIPDIRILAHDPSDLLPPGWSEPERYFFTCKEAKYVKGRRANRATGAGYWKATGKEKPVSVSAPGVGGGQPVLVGMKRSLVFYRGKPPSGRKTEWVMHEYRLAGAGLAPCRPRAATPPHQQQQSPRAPAEGWVLCRVFRKKGSAAAVAAMEAEAAGARGGEDDDHNCAEEEEEEEEVVADAEEEDAAAASSGFIDFFARADAARRGQQHAEEEPGNRASSPVVSSSCLTDASLELRQCCREQETTSSSRGA